MPTLQIPEYFRTTIERLASMSSEDFERVRVAIERSEPNVKPEVLVSQAQSAANVGGAPDIVEIVQSLASLSIARLKTDTPIDEFARDVALSLPKLRDKSIDRAALEAKLKALLSAESLLVSARAFDVQHEYEHVFRSARIVTDVRTVFDHAGAKVLGAMIVHNLAISYVHNAEAKEIMFALDDSDLSELKKVLDRAETKTNTLEALIARATVPYFESKAKT